MDPRGGVLQMPVSWLDGSSFHDYLIPGLILLLTLGCSPYSCYGSLGTAPVDVVCRLARKCGPHGVDPGGNPHCRPPAPASTATHLRLARHRDIHLGAPCAQRLEGVRCPRANNGLKPFGAQAVLARIDILSRSDPQVRRHVSSERGFPHLRGSVHLPVLRVSTGSIPTTWALTHSAGIAILSLRTTWPGLRCQAAGIESFASSAPRRRPLAPLLLQSANWGWAGIRRSRGQNP